MEPGELGTWSGDGRRGKDSEPHARPLQQYFCEWLVAEQADPTTDACLVLVRAEGHHDGSVVFGLRLNLVDRTVSPGSIDVILRSAMASVTAEPTLVDDSE